MGRTARVGLPEAPRSASVISRAPRCPPSVTKIVSRSRSAQCAVGMITRPGRGASPVTLIHSLTPSSTPSSVDLPRQLGGSKLDPSPPTRRPSAPPRLTAGTCRSTDAAALPPPKEEAKDPAFALDSAVNVSRMAASSSLENFERFRSSTAAVLRRRRSCSCVLLVVRPTTTMNSPRNEGTVSLSSGGVRWFAAPLSRTVNCCGELDWPT